MYICFPNSPSACFVREPNLKISSFMGSFTVRGQRGGGGFPKKLRHFYVTEPALLAWKSLGSLRAGH
jgi:hypothetical protein